MRPVPFDDPLARQMAGDLGESIVRELPHGGSMAWAVVVRTAVMDEILLDQVAQGVTQVLNLGAGLDTRAFRLALPSSLSWFGVDLPRMVTHRQACLKGLKPHCRHAHIAADVTRPLPKPDRRRLLGDLAHQRRILRAGALPGVGLSPRRRIGIEVQPGAAQLRRSPLFG